MARFVPWLVVLTEVGGCNLFLGISDVEQVDGGNEDGGPACEVECAFPEETCSADGSECVCSDGYARNPSNACAPSVTGTLADRNNAGTWLDGSRATSCNEYLEGNDSHVGSEADGFYELALSDGVATVYCDMESSGGWTGVDPLAAEEFGVVVTAGPSGTPCTAMGVAAVADPGEAYSCRFDIDLRVPFNRIRLSSLPDLQVAIENTASTDTTLADVCIPQGDWSQCPGFCSPAQGGAGSVVIGNQDNSQLETLRLGAALEVDDCQGPTHRTFPGEQQLYWPGDNTVQTALGSVLRIQLADNAVNGAAGMRWSGGFVFVLHEKP